MENTTQQALLALRDTVIGDLTPLIQGSNIDDQQKFTILLSSARNTRSEETFKSAREAALGIDDAGAKADALLELLDELDFQIQETNSPESEPEDNASNNEDPSPAND